MKKLALTGFSDEISPVFDEQLAALKEFGVSYLELRGADGVNVSDLSPEKLKEIKRKLKETGISVSSIGSPIGKISIEDDFAAHMEKLKRTLEIQKELNAPYLRMFSFYLPKENPTEQYREQVLEQVGKMVEEAARWESVLLHENEKGIYGDTAPRCLDLMRQLSSPSFRAVFDFANFVEVGQDTLEAYEVLHPYIEYVHIKDCATAETTAEKRIVPAGQGDGHLREILADLLHGGWRGFLSLEPHLIDFTGLAALEQNAKKRDSALDGKSAWKLALDSLCGILRELPEVRVTGAEPESPHSGPFGRFLPFPL